MSESVSPLPQIIQHHPLLVMFTAPNPGPKTLEGTHSYLVGRECAYVVDPGPAIATYQEELVSWGAQAQVHLKGVLLTHGHPDHAPGAYRLRELLEIPVWIPENAGEEARAACAADRELRAGMVFPVDGDDVKVIETPGHSPDHLAFWLERSGVLFSGDTILGRGTSVVAPPEGDMIAYMRSLRRLRELNPRLILPGHGPLIEDPVAKVDEYIAHREAREAQVLDALNSGPASVAQLVDHIYADLAAERRELAAGSVAAQLAKLEREGRVRRIGDSYSAT